MGKPGDWLHVHSKSIYPTMIAGFVVGALFTLYRSGDITAALGGGVGLSVIFGVCWMLTHRE